ncbi:MAG: SCO family protein [Microthrixaceae bacterium]
MIPHEPTRSLPSGRDEAPTRRDVLRSAALGFGSAGLVAALAACGRSSGAATATGDDNRAENLGFYGTVLAEPLAKPTVVFTDTDGRAFDIASRTRGRLALLLFGYTSCPDVCPVHLSTLAATLKRVDGAAADTIVMFVGVDTARDTPRAIADFVHGRDPQFVGLTASPTDIDAALKELHLPSVVIGKPDSTGAYSVGHPSQILAFTPDDLCHIVYPFGTLQQQWATDLPKLLDYRWPAQRPAGAG